MEHEGKAAICGYYVNPSTGCAGRVIDASMTLDDKPAGSVRHFPQSRPGASAFPANCAVTEIPWEPRFGRALNPWDFLKPVGQGGRGAEAHLLRLHECSARALKLRPLAG